MTKRGAPGRVSRESWIVAALEALATNGLEAVAVEPIAKELGVTKGSFYWHFENRQQLLEAALASWETHATTAVIAVLEKMPDPMERLRYLFRRVAIANEGKSSIAAVHAALGASSDPVAKGVVDRVAKARLAYVEKCYRELGFSNDKAAEHAFLAYATYLGLTRLVHDIPNDPRVSTNLEAYTEFVIDALIPRPAGDPRARGANEEAPAEREGRAPSRDRR
jgi:AcrR family transcriptional regulator